MTGLVAMTGLSMGCWKWQQRTMPVLHMLYIEGTKLLDTFGKAVLQYVRNCKSFRSNVTLTKWSCYMLYSKSAELTCKRSKADFKLAKVLNRITEKQLVAIASNRFSSNVTNCISPALMGWELFRWSSIKAYKEHLIQHSTQRCIIKLTYATRWKCSMG